MVTVQKLTMEMEETKPEASAVNTEPNSESAAHKDTGDGAQNHFDDIELDVKKDEANAEAKTSPDNETPQPPPPTPRFLFLLTIFATQGGFLLGYDIGIMSGSMLYVQPYFNLLTVWTEAIVSGAVGAAAISSLMGGWLADKIGRRRCILTSSVVFSLGGVLMGAAPTQEVLLVGRIICGLGIGLASVVGPVYMAETSPLHLRGRLTTMWQMLINFGVLVSSLIAAAFSYVHPYGWRIMLGLSALPGIVQFVGFLFMPESPRWLVSKGQVDSARDVLVRLRGHKDVTEELNEIKMSVDEAKAKTQGGLKLLLQICTTKHVRRALVVGMGLLFFQQWCGINTAIYYSGTVLKMAGFPARLAVWLAVVPNALLFLAGISGMFIVDRIGRRPLLLWSMFGTTLGLVVIAVGFQLSTEYGADVNSTIIETFENGSTIQRCHSQYTSCSLCVKDIGCGFCYDDVTSGSCLPSANEERSLYGRCNASSGADDDWMKFTYEYCPSDYSLVAAIGVALFVFLFSPGMAPMPWTINAEIYPMWARGTCTSIAATVAWTSNLIISFTFLSMTEAITTHGTFWLFTALSVLGLLFFVWLVPETKGKSLEHVEELFMSPEQRERRRNTAITVVAPTDSSKHGDGKDESKDSK